MTFQGVNDLNLGCHFRQSFGTFPGGTDAHWQSRVLTTYGVRAVAYVSSFGGEISWRFRRPHIQLPGSISVAGLCTADLPRKPARHRGVSACAAHQTLSYGAARQSEPQRPGRRQRVTRLAHLCRVCPRAYPHRTPAVCPGASGSGSRRDSLRPGCHHHRLVLVAVSVGQVPQNQSGGKTAHAARLAWCYSELHPHLRRQTARCQRPRRAHCRAGRLLRDGSWLPRLRAALPPPSGRQLLCHPRQIQLQIQAPVFSPGRSQYRIALRPRSRTRCILLPPRLPRAAASHSLSRCRRSATGILDQSYDVGAFDRLRVVSLALASRTVLQMDQAAPAHQTLLWHLRERREDPSLDRGRCVRISCHRSQASQSGVVLTRNVTDSEHHTIRENPDDSAPYLLCNQRKYLRRSQSTDFTMKRVGHYCILVYFSKGCMPSNQVPDSLLCAQCNGFEFFA